MCILFIFLISLATQFMKKLLILLAMVFFTMTISFNIYGQTDADKVEGVWKTGEGNALVQIQKAKSGNYFGRIVWLKVPLDDAGKPKTDINNSDESQKNKPLLGLVNLMGFKYDANEKKWIDGTIYDPKNGQTYKSNLWLENDNELNVRGFIGVSLFGRTDKWTRQQK